MSAAREEEKLRQTAERQIRRQRANEQDKRDIYSAAAKLGLLGLVGVLPVVGGAYLGLWLDNHFGTYGFTLLLILVGVLVGAWNVSRQLR